MIAVFTRTQKDFESLRCTPRKEFKSIKNVNDTRGQTFAGIVVIPDYYENREVNDALESLKYRQPELFKK